MLSNDTLKHLTFYYKKIWYFLLHKSVDNVQNP